MQFEVIVDVQKIGNLAMEYRFNAIALIQIAANALNQFLQAGCQMQLENSSYSSSNPKRGFCFAADFSLADKLEPKSQLDSWLTERYCVFLPVDNGIYEYDVHHLPWEIRVVKIKSLKVNYRFGTIDLSAQAPSVAQYSEGVKVLAWKRRKL